MWSGGSLMIDNARLMSYNFINEIFDKPNKKKIGMF